MATALLQSIDQQTQLAGHNRLALLLFRLGGGACYGVNVFKVQGVIPLPTIHPVPEAHRLVAGVALVRGRTIPILNLMLAVGDNAADGGLETPGVGHVIVTEFNRSVQGFLVGSVDRIVNVSVENVRPPPETVDGSRLTAVTQVGDMLVQIIDVEQVLADVMGASRDVSAGIKRQLPAGSKPLRVLVADDSRVARAQIGRILDQIGVEAIQVNDGRQALKFLQSLADTGEPVSKQLAMVISDIEMPDMDGYTLATEIRRDPRLRDLYVLLHTSMSGVFNHAMVEKVGANRFIAKFSADELAQAVLQVLDPPKKPH